MNKKRHLRPSIEKFMTIVFTIIACFFAMLDDFELSFIPVLIILMAIMLFNFIVLKKYGRNF